MNFIESYSKEAVDKYLNYAKKKFEEVEETKKYIIPPAAPITIVYELGHATVIQLNSKLLTKLPTTTEYILYLL